MNKYLLILIAAILSAASPIYIKKYINSGETNNYYLAIAIISSILVVFTYYYLCKSYTASQMYTIVKILAIILVTVAGYLYLSEKIKIKQIIGILFGIVALILISSK